MIDEIFGMANTVPSGCQCAACTPNYTYFRVCSTCGNKRCPHSTNHRWACTGSNEPGQPGSSYGPDLSKPVDEVVGTDPWGRLRDASQGIINLPYHGTDRIIGWRVPASVAGQTEGLYLIAAVEDDIAKLLQCGHDLKEWIEKDRQPADTSEVAYLQAMVATAENHLSQRTKAEDPVGFRRLTDDLERFRTRLDELLTVT